MDKRKEENLRVKKAIVLGYFSLLDKYQNDKISVSMIADYAHVSRMSYYRNFDSKNDIIIYFLESVLDEITSKLSSDCTFWSSEYGYVFLQVLTKYKSQFLQLDKYGFMGLVQTMFNEANINLEGDMPSNSIKRYNLYFASGATLNGIMEWFRNDCREPIDEFYQNLMDFLGI